MDPQKKNEATLNEDVPLLYKARLKHGTLKREQQYKSATQRKLNSNMKPTPKK